MDLFSRGLRCAVLALQGRELVLAGLRALVCGWCVCVLVVLHAATAAAQSTTNQMPAARVTRDQVTIWKADFRVAAAVVRVGTVLTVLGGRGDWYEVVVAGDQSGRTAATGFIFKSNVELLDGAAPAPPPQVRDRDLDTARRSASSTPSVGYAGWGHFGYTWFAARNSFQAVLGQGGGALLGGGGEVRLGRGFFVGGSVERFSKTGERVFVFNDEVFKLGIPNTITMTPMAVTAGWRFVTERVTPYVGAGTGSILYKESSSFAEATENVEQRFRSYHMLGGVEFRNGWVATAFEVQYARVPDAIGVAGSSAAFEEHNLGGLVSRVKIMVGR